MKIELTETTISHGKVERGTIEGLDAQINHFDSCVAVGLTQWSPLIRSVSVHAPTRGEAIAEAVRMARACGLVAP